MTARRPEALLAELDRLEALRDPARNGSHNRQFKRFVVRGEAELHPMSRARLDRTPIDIKIRDLGRGGCGFITQQPLQAGSNWRVCFLQHGYVVGEQAIVVRHCRPVSDGLHLVGAQFVMDTGLMTTLGIDPGSIHDEDTVEDTLGVPSAFLAPGEVA